MRIQHNIMAMSAYRNYTNNVSAMQKNLEKLSSGYKINRAGDDAAGLAISEKMRAQITGLETAQKNAKDGISLVQTAEGALTEVHDMLNRMVELATQSANGTYDNDTDREQLQKEMDQLLSEINRIADSSNFNGIKLLDGSMDAGGGTKQVAITLPEDSATQFGEIGEKTILKGAGSAAKGTVFGVQFDNLAIDAKAGDKLTVQVGTDTIDITLANAQKYDASALADELVKACTKNGAAEATIGGQTFTVAKGADGTSVTFTQKAAPTSASEVVEASMDVKMTYTPTGGTAQVLNDEPVDGGYTVYNATGGTINSDGAKTDIELIDALTTGGDAVTGTIAAGADLATVLDSKTAGDGEISVGYADGKWTISIGADNDKVTIEATGSYADGVMTLTSEGSTLLTITASDKDASGLDADKFTAAFTGTGTATGLTYTTGATQPENPDEGGGNTTEKVTGATQITGLTDLDPDAATANTNITAADAGAINTWLGTAKVTVDGHEIDLSSADKLKIDGQATVDDLAQSIGAVVKEALGKVTDATYSDIKVSIGNASDIAVQTAGDTVDVTVTATKAANQGGGDATGAGVSGSYNAATVKIDQGATVVADQRASTTINLGTIFGGDIGDGSTLTIGKETYTFKWGDSNSFNGTTITLDKNATAADRINYAAKAMSNMSNSAFSIGNETTDGKLTIDEKAGNTLYTTELGTHDGFESLFSAKSVSAEDTTKGLKLQIGDTADPYNQLRVSIGDTHVASLGLANISIKDQDSAAKAIDAIKTAINTVSDIRGTLGATQNRLDHTINNLSVMTENIQDAESTIRDVDVAEEMMAYTKNNILIQSAQAMLAQANQVPQGVLQLLQ